MSDPSPENSPPPSASPLTFAPAGVRYSLPDMLAELKLERASGSFAMEKLDQVEIGKLFKTPARRRAKSKK